MEAQGDPFRRRSQRGKAAIDGFCKQNPSPYPPNLPDPPRTSPMSPPLTKRKFVSLLESGGDMGEVFCVWGGMNLLQSAAIALFLWAGCVGRVYAFCKCRFIPPHQSLTRQLPPKGKPFYRVQTLQIQLFRQQDTANNTLDFRPFILLCSAKGILQKGFPSGGSWRASD